jgi:hypothetical protein
MRSRIRSNVEKNTEYHEALASGYDRLIHQAAAGKKDHHPDPKLAYLAKLHGDVAKQLRDVLAQDTPRAINQAVAERLVRRVQNVQSVKTGRLN